MDRSPFPRLTVFSQPVEEPRAGAGMPVAQAAPAAQRTVTLDGAVRGGGAAAVPTFGDWREQREAHAVDSPVETPIAAVVVDEAVRIEGERATMLVTPPDEFDHAPVREDAVVEAYVVEAPVEVPAPRVAQVQRAIGERPSHAAMLDQDPTRAVALDHEGLPIVDVEALRARDVARELLRARFLAIGERRERRSAWEVAFIMLAAAIAVLLTAPPLVQVLLAMHGVEA